VSAICNTGNFETDIGCDRNPPALHANVHDLPAEMCVVGDVVHPNDVEHDIDTETCMDFG
jgi:hypothetical protein